MEQKKNIVDAEFEVIRGPDESPPHDADLPLWLEVAISVGEGVLLVVLLIAAVFFSAWISSFVDLNAWLDALADWIPGR